MRLRYIYHSGYVIEADGFTIVMDYYKDTGPGLWEGYIHDKLLYRPGPLYVLASHFHPDHFNPEVLEWKKQKEDIRYIFSSDIWQHGKARKEDAFYLEQGGTYKDENLSIRAFGSTDIGVSFLIETGGKRIFHAGDLNNWHWKDESTLEEAVWAEKRYLHELSLLAEAVDRLDVVMFPVDPRIGSQFALGAEQFIDRIPTDLFAPMHFAEWYAKLIPFGKYAEAHGVVFAGWTAKGQNLEF